ncbi:unnamed protein product [Choristocarpus tenellus]
MLPAKFLEPWDILEMDLQDVGHISTKGKKYMLIVIDRASRFPFAFPMASKDATGVATNVLELCLTFGIPLSIRSDAGGDFTGDVMSHLCRLLKVPINYGPTGNSRGQGGVENMGGLLLELLSELCVKWPDRWDEYVSPACWAQRTTPDLSDPLNPTSFRVLFGRDPRTQLDAVIPKLDGDVDVGGLDSFIEQRRQNFREVREVLERRMFAGQRQREKANALVARSSPGLGSKPGDLVLVKEADSSIYGEKLGQTRVGRKVVHERWTGPWTVQ